MPGEVIRFVFLSTHYRKPMDWTEKKAREAEKTLNHWLDLTVDLEPTDPREFKVRKGLIDALSDDLNTHKALQYLNSSLIAAPQQLLDHARFLGFLSDATREGHREQYLKRREGGGSSAILASLAADLDGLRRQAMETKDFSKVDRLKAAYIEAGLEVRMSKTGVELVPGPGFDPAKLEDL